MAITLVDRVEKSPFPGRKWAVDPVSLPGIDHRPHWPKSDEKASFVKGALLLRTVISSFHRFPEGLVGSPCIREGAGARDLVACGRHASASPAAPSSDTPTNTFLSLVNLGLTPGSGSQWLKNGLWEVPRIPSIPTSISQHLRMTLHLLHCSPHLAVGSAHRHLRSPKEQGAVRASPRMFLHGWLASCIFAIFFSSTDVELENSCDPT